LKYASTSKILSPFEKEERMESDGEEIPFSKEWWDQRMYSLVVTEFLFIFRIVLRFS
jgi:hypothetical protein